VSIICDETDKSIAFDEPLMAGTREDVEFFSALSQEVLSKIPEDEKREEPCGSGDEGIDIHEASGLQNGIGNYLSTRGFELGKFCYSISKETAEQYLPKHYRRYVAAAV
jgi:hypothetical protein